MNISYWVLLAVLSIIQWLQHPELINQCIKTKHCNIIFIISHWHRLVIAYRIVLKSRFARGCKNWDFSCVCKKSQKSQGWQFFESQLRKLRKIKVWWFLALVGIFRSSLSCWCSLFLCSWSLKSTAGCQFYQSCNKSDNFLLYLPFWHLPVRAIKAYLHAKADAAL